MSIRHFTFFFAVNSKVAGRKHESANSPRHDMKTGERSGATANKNRSRDDRKVEMEKLKDIFADKALTYDEFEKALGEAKIKLADLSEGTYVDKRKYEALDADYKKQLEANKQELETLKAKGDNSTELQVKIDALEKEKQELKAKQRETGVQLDKLSRRELASSKTGIHDPDFLDLMQARYGEQKMEDFEKSVVEYAEANKQKWSATSPSPNLNGEPSVKQDADAAMRESIMRAAGAIYDDKK